MVTGLWQPVTPLPVRDIGSALTDRIVQHTVEDKIGHHWAVIGHCDPHDVVELEFSRSGPP